MVIDEQQASIAAMHDRMERQQVAVQPEEHQASAEVPVVEKPMPTPQLRPEPSFMAKVGIFVKNFFAPTSQRKPA